MGREVLGRRRAIAVGLAVLGSVLSACEWPVTDDLQTAIVLNETDRDVVVFLDYPDGETSIMELAPGQSDSTDFSYPTDGCAPATLIARDASGREVERIGRDFCVGDRWEIRGDS